MLGYQALNILGRFPCRLNQGGFPLCWAAEMWWQWWVPCRGLCCWTSSSRRRMCECPSSAALQLFSAAVPSASLRHEIRTYINPFTRCFAAEPHQGRLRRQGGTATGRQGECVGLSSSGRGGRQPLLGRFQGHSRPQNHQVQAEYFVL